MGCLPLLEGVRYFEVRWKTRAFVERAEPTEVCTCGCVFVCVCVYVSFGGLVYKTAIKSAAGKTVES